MILATITCDVKDCNASETEKTYGSGWQGWGSIQGIHNPATGADVANVCPECKEKLINFLEGN